MTGENLGLIFHGPLTEYITGLPWGDTGKLWYIPALDDKLYSLDVADGTVEEVLSGLDVIHVSGLTIGPGSK